MCGKKGEGCGPGEPARGGVHRRDVGQIVDVPVMANAVRAVVQRRAPGAARGAARGAGWAPREVPFVVGLKDSSPSQGRSSTR